jgi:CubicO group peptidase (beta-lactamase class C family)
VLEAYYAPYAEGMRHAAYSVAKAITGALTAIAWKDGLLDSPNHRVLELFDHSAIANLDDRKEAITIQNLLDMTSGIEWTQPLVGRCCSHFTDRNGAQSRLGQIRSRQTDVDWSRGRTSTITTATRSFFPRSLLSSRE